MRRLYCHLLQPHEHPDYRRRPVQPPGWAAYEGRTRFAVLRGFTVEDGRITDAGEQITRHVDRFELGDVLWPSYPILFADNLSELVEDIRRRGLLLFDIWGYVPGSGPGGYWQQFQPPKEALALLEARLGERWLGMDVGEQDGRYIGGYAGQMHPVSADRVSQYLNFQRHFERLCDQLGNRMSTLVSLNFGHHLLKEGVYTTIGAETAQGLPNGQVYYAFIRGAGKQYGVPWFGNASVWNRWGWKTYESQGEDHGPDRGTSLSLLKRLLYSHVLYNCVIVGFESSWFAGEDLSPVGRIQQAARRWVRQHPDLGCLATPVALMIDFFSGWSFPRHLYTSRVYRAWGNIPFGPGDFLTDGVLDLLYPGYQDASFFHDESGFLTPTPYGDCADVVLTDAAGWLLSRYALLLVAGEVAGGAELRDKLAAYARQGGHLVITAGSLARLPGGLAGLQVGGSATLAAGTQVAMEGAVVTEDCAFELRELVPPGGLQVADADAEVPDDEAPRWRALATCADRPAVVTARLGHGRITVLAAPFGLPAQPRTQAAPVSSIDAPLATPFPLLRHVRATLGGVLREQVLFEAGDGLSVIVCRGGPGRYTVALANNGLTPRPFRLVSRCGPLRAACLLPLDESEKGAPGYLPTGMADLDVGVSALRLATGEPTSPGDAGSPCGASGTLAGGDLCVLQVTVDEEGVVPLPHAAPPSAPRGRGLPLRGMRSIQEELLRRPTFFEHFDSVAVDWRYLTARDATQVAAEAPWIRRQGLRVLVDLASGVNLYPDLRLVRNLDADYAASRAAIDGLLAKMTALGAADLILPLHRVPENNITPEQTWESFAETLGQICATAAGARVTVHLRHSRKDGRGLGELVRLARGVAAPNLRVAASTALLLDNGADREALDAAGQTLGLWLASAAAYDLAGAMWTANAPVASAEVAAVRALLDTHAELPVLLDGVYDDWDAEYLDAKAVSHL